jgi:flavin reductase (DIM6/NTAB) family NADH-FMN oxidoreductase RutF
VPHTISELGLPLLEGALAHLECVTVSAHVEGDHTIFVGRVERMGVPGGEPLLYFKGKYERLNMFVEEPSQGSPNPSKAGA